MKTGKRIAFALGVACMGLGVANCSKPQAEGGLVYVKKGDPEIDAARAEARKTLPHFWERYSKRAAQDSNFAIKFDLNHGHPERGEAELIWTTNVQKLGDRITANLNNVPETPGFHHGQYVEIPEEAIVDWQIEVGGKYQGHYSTRVLATRVDPAEAEVIRSALW